MGCGVQMFTCNCDHFVDLRAHTVLAPFCCVESLGFTRFWHHSVKLLVLFPEVVQKSQSVGILAQSMGTGEAGKLNKSWNKLFPFLVRLVYLSRRIFVQRLVIKAAKQE